MLRKSHNAVKKYLLCKGFTSTESQGILAGYVLFTMASCGLGLLALPLTKWSLAFGLGTLLAAINLWQIARFSHWSVTRRFTGKLAAIGFFAFIFRFAGTGIVLYLLLIQVRMPVIPLLAGMFSLVLWLSVMRFFHSADNSRKEA